MSSKECSKCKAAMWSKDERERGICSSCEVASWTPEKRKAFGKLLGMAFKSPLPTEAEKDAAIEEAFKHL